MVNIVGNWQKNNDHQQNEVTATDTDRSLKDWINDISHGLERITYSWQRRQRTRTTEHATAA